MKLLTQILTVIGAIILATHIITGRIKGSGSWEATDATAITMLAIAIRMMFSSAPDGGED